MREIKPINNNGSIQLKFSFSGKRYSFNPVPRGTFANKRDTKTASAIATKIQNDILAGCFDKTLEKYKLAPKATPEDAPVENLLSLWDTWVKTLNLSKEAGWTDICKPFQERLIKLGEACLSASV